MKWTRTETKEHRFLTPGEFRESLTLMPEHFHAFIEFLVEAGARFNEVTGLRPSDVNRETGAIKVRKALLDKLDHWHEYPIRLSTFRRGTGYRYLYKAIDPSHPSPDG